MTKEKNQYIPYRASIHALPIPEYHDQETGLSIPHEALLLNQPSYKGHQKQTTASQPLFESHISYMVETKVFEELLQSKNSKSYSDSRNIGMMYEGKIYTFVRFNLVHEAPFITNVVFTYSNKRLLEYILLSTHDFTKKEIKEIVDASFPVLREP